MKQDTYGDKDQPSKKYSAFFIELVKPPSWGGTRAGRTRISPAGWPALFLNLTFLLKASTFWHFGTVKVYSPNIFLSYIKKIWQIPTEIKSKKVKVKK